MKSHPFIIAVLGLACLAGVFTLHFRSDQTPSTEAVPKTTSAKHLAVMQKPALIHPGLLPELPTIADQVAPLNLERFKTTPLPPEVLKKDIWLFSNSGNGSAKEFREALSRHFPSHELELGHTGPEVLQCLKDMSAEFVGSSHLHTDDLGRLGPDMPLIVYIHRVLDQSAPQEERNRFCRVVDSLVRLCGDHPNELALSTYLSEICGRSYFVWGPIKGIGAEAASAKWRSSEVFRHLAYGEPPVSEDFKVLVQADNRKGKNDPSSTKPNDGK
jgi:hypothetical protein